MIVAHTWGVRGFIGRRRWSIQLLALLLILLHSAAVRAAEVVIVRASDAEPYVQAETALRDQLTKQHYTMRTVLMKDVSQKRIDSVIGKPDAVVAVGTSAAHWLHKELPASTPLLYCLVSNAADAGLLGGRSATGVTTDIALAAQFKLIAEALPKARVVGTLYRSDTPEGKSALQSLSNAMPKGWRVESVAVNEFPTLADAIDALTTKKIDIVWTTADQKLYDTAAVRTLLLAALRAKLPVWGFSPAFVRAGALIGVGVDPRAQGAQVADLVVKVIADSKKAPTGAVPPDEFQIAVNLIVAEQVGVEIPASLTDRATFVYRPEK